MPFAACSVVPFRHAGAMGFLAWLLSAAACDAPAGPQQTALSGAITIEGRPLDVPATIYFQPSGGSPEEGCRTQVAEGRYRFSADAGPFAGRDYRVTVITSAREPGLPQPRDPRMFSKRFEKAVKIPSGEPEAQLNIDFDIIPE